jgi:hypothetical protein
VFHERSIGNLTQIAKIELASAVQPRGIDFIPQPSASTALIVACRERVVVVDVNAKTTEEVMETTNSTDVAIFMSDSITYSAVVDQSDGVVIVLQHDSDGSMVECAKWGVKGQNVSVDGTMGCVRFNMPVGIAFAHESRTAFILSPGRLVRASCMRGGTFYHGLAKSCQEGYAAAGYVPPYLRGAAATERRGISLADAAVKLQSSTEFIHKWVVARQVTTNMRVGLDDGCLRNLTADRMVINSRMLNKQVKILESHTAGMIDIKDVKARPFTNEAAVEHAHAATTAKANITNPTMKEYSEQVPSRELKYLLSVTSVPFSIHRSRSTAYEIMQQMTKVPFLEVQDAINHADTVCNPVNPDARLTSEQKTAQDEAVARCRALLVYLRASPTRTVRTFQRGLFGSSPFVVKCHLEDGHGEATESFLSTLRDQCGGDTSLDIERLRETHQFLVGDILIEDAENALFGLLQCTATFKRSRSTSRCRVKCVRYEAINLDLSSFVLRPSQREESVFFGSVVRNLTIPREALDFSQLTQG